MRIVGREFDSVIEIDVDPAKLGWPRGAEAAESDVGGNRLYWRLSRFGWSRVRGLIYEETAFAERLNAALELEAPDEDLQKQSEDAARSLIGLDPGTNALVAALRAARCFPYYSCNGGAFGGDHGAVDPAIGFYCKPLQLPLVIDAARVASVGLYNNHADGVTAYARHVGAFIGMAAALYQIRDDLDRIDLRSRKADRAGTAADDRQYGLF